MIVLRRDQQIPRRIDGESVGPRVGERVFLHQYRLALSVERQSHGPYERTRLPGQGHNRASRGTGAERIRDGRARQNGCCSVSSDSESCRQSRVVWRKVAIPVSRPDIPGFEYCSAAAKKRAATPRHGRADRPGSRSPGLRLHLRPGLTRRTPCACICAALNKVHASGDAAGSPERPDSCARRGMKVQEAMYV